MMTCTVATPKGGVGKSTTAAELVLALSRRDQRVLAIDLDQQGNLTARLGLTASMVGHAPAGAGRGSSSPDPGVSQDWVS